jgi:hypothetical protein
MTNPFRLNLIHIFTLVVVVLFLGAFQTTFWFQIFGSIPAPMLWLILVLYLFIYRGFFEAVALTYFLCLFLAPLTSTPLGVLWLSLLILAGLTQYLRKRFFWPGLKYFVSASLLATLSYQIIYQLTCYYVDNRWSSIDWFSRFAELILTPLAAVPIYTMMALLDRITQKETLPEAGSLEA